MNETTSAPGSASRPLRASSSMRKANASIFAPSRSRRRRVAAAVPPVASKSSIDDDAIAVAKCIGVDFERVRAVLERVRFGKLAVRQLSGLSNRNETGPYTIGKRGAEHVPACFDAHDVPDLAALEAVDEQVDCRFETLRVFEQRGDVAKEYPGQRKIGDRSNEVLDAHEQRGFERRLAAPSDPVRPTKPRRGSAGRVP